MVPTPACLLSLCIHLRSFFKFPIVTWQRKRNLRPVLQIVQHDMQEPLKDSQLQHYIPSLGYPWRTVVKKKSPRWQNFKQCPWLFTVCGGEMAKCLITHCRKAVNNGLSGWSGTWKEDDWRIDDRQSFGKWHMNEHLWICKICEDIKTPLKFSLKNLSRGRV